MRDPKAYVKAKRSDPHSPAEMLQHPYDFVSLPDRPRRTDGVTHDDYPAHLWSGKLRLVYRTEAPLHVGSGVFESAQECGLRGGNQPVRGVLRSCGRPVLPGSSWKGAVRSRFEAITRSRLAIVGKVGKEDVFKVPQVLRQDPRRKHRFEIHDGRVTGALAPQRIVREAEHLRGLSPADALFGCMGYRGRVHPGEGEIDGPAAERALRVAALDSPQIHRLAKPHGMRHVGGVDYHMTEIEGRKFYYDGDVVSCRQIRDRGGHREVFEFIDYVSEGSTIALDLRLRSVSEEELGALLVSAGYGEEVGVVRFGGYKSVGLGKVRLESASAVLHHGIDARRWRRKNGEPFELDRAVEAAKRELLDLPRLAELHRVTTMWRPSA